MRYIHILLLLCFFSQNSSAGIFSDIFYFTLFSPVDFTSRDNPEVILERNRANVLSIVHNRVESEARDTIISRIANTWAENHLNSSSKRIVSLLIGNAYDEPTPHEALQIRELVQLLLKSHFIILYDADSKTAPIIETEAPEHFRIGISARVNFDNSKVLSIPIPRIRTWTYQIASSALIAPNSPVGIGLYLDNFSFNKNQLITIFEPSFEGTTRATGLIELAKKLNTNTPPIYTHPSATVKNIIGSGKVSLSRVLFRKAIPKFNIDEEIRHSNAAHIHYYLDKFNRVSHHYDNLPYRIQSSIGLLGSDQPIPPSKDQASLKWIEQYPELSVLSYFLSETLYPVYSNGKGDLIREVSAPLAKRGAPSYGVIAEEPFTRHYKIPSYLTDLILTRNEEDRWHILTRPFFKIIHSVNREVIAGIGQHLIEEGGKTQAHKFLAFVGPSVYWLNKTHLLELPLPKKILSNISIPKTIDDFNTAASQSELEYSTKLITAPKPEDLEKARLALEERRREEERRRKEVEEKRQNELLIKMTALKRQLNETLTNSSSSHSIYVTELRSRLNSLWLRNLSKHFAGSIFLGIGNSESIFTDLELQELIELCKELNERNKLVIYDADSPAKAIIEKWINPRLRTGLTSQIQKANEKVLFIGNPYLRMQSMLLAKTFIISPSSTVGIALLIESYRNPEKSFMILDPLGQWPKTGLSDWQKNLDNGFMEEKIFESSRLRTSPLTRHEGSQIESIENDENKASADLKKDLIEITTLLNHSKTRVSETSPKNAIKTWWKSHFGKFKLSKENPSRETKRQNKGAQKSSDGPSKQSQSLDHSADLDLEEVLIPQLIEEKIERVESISKGLDQNPNPSLIGNEESNFTPRRTRLENLGIDYPSPLKPSVHERASTLVNDISGPHLFHGGSWNPVARDSLSRDRNFIPPYSAETFLESLSYESLLQLKESSDSYLKCIEYITHEQNNSSLPLLPGAVVFGSAKGSSLYAPLLSDTVLFFAESGFPIFTGGSGGYMQLANSIAKKKNVASIGIPLSGGRKSLINEKYVGVDQTHTILASGYEDRIPLLLHEKKAIIIAPGGPGTMKELATTLVHLSDFNQHESKTVILFVSNHYYQELFNWLMTLPFGYNLRNRMILISETNELKDIDFNRSNLP